MIAGQVGKSVCEDVDGKITVVLTFYAQTLGPFPYKATLQCCYFVTISAKFWGIHSELVQLSVVDLSIFYCL